MNLSRNTVLITGGAKNTGLALAEFLLTNGNEVIICGDNEDELEAAKDIFPPLEIKVCDLTLLADREHVAGWAQQKFPHLNMLIFCPESTHSANAPEPVEIKQQAEINFTASIHLSTLLLPHLHNNGKKAAIIIFTYPVLSAPPINSEAYNTTYSAAAFLRYRFKDLPVKIFEIVMAGNHKNTDVNKIVEATAQAIENDIFDVVIQNENIL